MAPPVSSALESTWAAQSDLPGLEPELTEKCVAGSGVIGRYAVLRRLGEGEFATVFECRRSDEGDEAPRYALKAINKAKVQRHSSLLKSKRNIRRVNTEVLAMRRFAHAGICQLIDVMQSPSFVYIVMEMGERDLFNFLDDHPSGCSDIVIKQIMRILALGLRHCHNHGIAHRDIKPENILVCGHPEDWFVNNNSEAGIVKLCDFGLCATVHEGCMLNDFVGSPGFFAPELMMRRQYDGACADMWSIGAVMVEMLLGHREFDNLWCPPYEHLHDVNAFSCGIAEAVSRVKLGSADGPPSDHVHKLLEQLLQVEPERRATIQEVCNARWFDLLKSTPGGAMQILRLTFDRDRLSFDANNMGKPSERRTAYRETPRAAARSLLSLQPHSLETITASLSLSPDASPSNDGQPQILSLSELANGGTNGGAHHLVGMSKPKLPLNTLPGSPSSGDAAATDAAQMPQQHDAVAYRNERSTSDNPYFPRPSAAPHDELLRCATPDTPTLLLRATPTGAQQ